MTATDVCVLPNRNGAEMNRGLLDLVVLRKEEQINEASA